MAYLHSSVVQDASLAYTNVSSPKSLRIKLTSEIRSIKTYSNKLKKEHFLMNPFTRTLLTMFPSNLKTTKKRKMLI